MWARFQLRWGCRTSRRVQLHTGIQLAVDDLDGLRGDGGDVRAVWARERLRGGQWPGRRVLVLAGVRVGVADVSFVRRCRRNMHWVRARIILCGHERAGGPLPRGDVRCDRELEYGGMHGAVHDRPLLRCGLNGTRGVPAGNVRRDVRIDHGRVLGYLHRGLLLRRRVDHVNRAAVRSRECVPRRIGGSDAVHL